MDYTYCYEQLPNVEEDRLRTNGPRAETTLEWEIRREQEVKDKPCFQRQSEQNCTNIIKAMKYDFLTYTPEYLEQIRIQILPTLPNKLDITHPYYYEFNDE